MKKLLITIIVLLSLVLVASGLIIAGSEEFKQIFGFEQNHTNIMLAGFDSSLLSDTEYFSPELEPEPEPDDYYAQTGLLELPVSGASGYASVWLDVFEGPATDYSYLTSLYPGQGFTILSEDEAWWEIDFQQARGWVQHRSCMINLPDVIPSIVYFDANVWASVMRSSGYDIPDVTGWALYDAYGYNSRFGEDQYVMPVLYSMAKKICMAQHAALAEGNTLIIYEAFRPYEAQQRVFTNLSALINSNSMVAAGVTKSPWSIGWFIAEGVSNHQVGYAIDVTLGRVLEQEQRQVGHYLYLKTTDWEEYVMPTSMHELSAAAVVFTQPVSSNSSTAWQTATLARSMNIEAITLQNYCTDAGMTPLASEWWHFNDHDSRLAVEPLGGNGAYLISEAFSIPPLE